MAFGYIVRVIAACICASAAKDGDYMGRLRDQFVVHFIKCRDVLGQIFINPLNHDILGTLGQTLCQRRVVVDVRGIFEFHLGHGFP